MSGSRAAAAVGCGLAVNRSGWLPGPWKSRSHVSSRRFTEKPAWSTASSPLLHKAMDEHSMSPSHHLVDEIMSAMEHHRQIEGTG